MAGEISICHGFTDQEINVNTIYYLTMREVNSSMAITRESDFQNRAGIDRGFPGSREISSITFRYLIWRFSAFDKCLCCCCCCCCFRRAREVESSINTYVLYLYLFFLSSQPSEGSLNKNIKKKKEI